MDVPVETELEMKNTHPQEPSAVTEAAPPAAAPMRRVLFVSYYFPPSGGPGVQRVLKFVRYLPQFGWQPVVLTVRPEDASYPDPDPAMLAEVPETVPVERTRAWDPYALYARFLGREKQETVGVGFIHAGEESWKERLAKWVRANLFLPDARVGWVPFALRRARQLLRETSFDVVVTSGPPQSTHLIGAALAAQQHVPWVADFRDPWTDISYYRQLPLTPLARRFDAAQERRVLERADAVVTVGPSLAKLLMRKTATPIHVIFNGFDESDFEGVDPVATEGFVIAHVGNLMGQQNPEALWRALAQLRRDGRIPELRLRMVGHLDASVAERIAANGLEPILERVPYVPHIEAIRHMVGASLLLLNINHVPNAELIVTGKVFEYIASGRPVLGIGPVPGDAATLLEKTGAGQLFDWSDQAGIRDFVRVHYEAWKQGEPIAGADRGRVQALTRVHQAGQLAQLLDLIAMKR